MPVPKRKLSRRRRDQRSANKHIVPKPFNICSTEDCQVAILPHRACYACGMYKGIKVIEGKAKIKVKEKPANQA